MKTFNVSALVLVILISSSFASAQRTTTPEIVVDDSYILALSAADQFAFAWAFRRADEGRATLTPAALRRHSPEDLTTLLQGVSSPHHESFEIGPGRKLSPTKYAFDVIQYDYLTKMGVRGPRPKPSRLVVVEVAPGQWLVDEFPDS
jgi:hypothetical protein